MASHSSATVREETPHVTKTTRTTIISDALKRRARSVISDKTIDPQWRTIIRAALELNDPCIAEFVSRAEAGENIADTFESLRAPVPNEVNSRLGKVEAVTEIICRAGDEPAAALFMLMETLESSTDPKVGANRAKHVAFSHCGELHVYEMIDAQIAEFDRRSYRGIRRHRDVFRGWPFRSINRAVTVANHNQLRAWGGAQGSQPQISRESQ